MYRAPMETGVINITHKVSILCLICTMEISWKELAAIFSFTSFTPNYSHPGHFLKYLVNYVFFIRWCCLCEVFSSNVVGWIAALWCDAKYLVYGITAFKLPPIMRRWIKPLVRDRIYCAAVFKSFVLVFVASCSSNRNWQDWTRALMKDLTANIDVMLQNYGHIFFSWHLGKLLQMLKMRCDQQRQRGTGWTAVDHNTLRLIFYETKIRARVYRLEPFWFWPSSLLDLGVLWLLSAFATDVEVLIDALPQDDLGRCLWDLLVWHILQLGPFLC